MVYINWRDTNNNIIDGAFQVKPKKIEDERGFFSRLIDKKVLEEKLNYKVDFIQVNNSLSVLKNTFRGFHLQLGKHSETKVVRCISGKVIDYILDLRPKSKTFLNIGYIELNPIDRNIAVLPKGCAHAIRTIEPNSEVIYLVDNEYNPLSEFGVRYNDKILKNHFKDIKLIISEKDKKWKDFEIGDIE
tara:strand:+ start:33 stop:596 length:564 start_codon:yes stop_codon:yes gene_type:complete